MSLIAYGFSISKANLDRIKDEKIKRMLLCFSVNANNEYYPEAYQYSNNIVSKLDNFIDVFESPEKNIDASVIGSFVGKKGGRLLKILRERWEAQGREEKDVELVHFIPAAYQNTLCFRFEIKYNKDTQQIDPGDYYQPSPPAKPDDDL